LFTFVFLMLACLCCKKGKIGFKKFKNVERDEYHTDMSTLASPASHNSPDVYVLPLTEVSLPVARQPSRSVQLLKTTDLSRHHLLYLKEIGNGWFGKVLLGEVNTGLNTTQVVVKELKSSAGVQDQMHFLEEAQPYRTLQHHALLQCLSQCTEVTPYLLVMEFCPLGDVKGYLQSCRAAENMTPEPLVLQQMACDIASGLLHLHKHNFTHSDLALRNCLLSANISVKIGDYGLSHLKYKEDYYVTSDQKYVPIRWIAPELVDEVHGNLLVADQTKQSNMWSLGVTIWELFELGNQPYRHYSDRQVLTYTVREQQLRLPKPLLKVPLAERWYEVMQFCWLQPDQRPNAEEVHLLLSYLCAKGASEAEEDFERRWNSLCPNTGFNSHCDTSAMSQAHPPSNTSSFPLLEQFSAGDGYHSESGDDILTVTETSHGLNFEYKWEQAKAAQSYNAPDSAGGLAQEVFYPPGGMVGGCPMESHSHGHSPSYYQAKHLHAPDILPVLSAHSPSLGSEYYIRLEEPVDCNIDPEYTMCSFSPDYQGSSGSFLTGSADSGECLACPSQSKNMGPYWSADIHKSDVFDSNDSSPAISLTMEPLLGQVSDSSPIRPWESSHYVSYKDRDGGYYYEHSPPLGMDPYFLGGDINTECHQESWGSRSLRQALGELENPLVSINMQTEGALFVSNRDSDSEEEEEELFVERHTCNTWPSKHRHNNVGQHRRISTTPCPQPTLKTPGRSSITWPSTLCPSPSATWSLISDTVIDVPNNEEMINLSPAPGGPVVAKTSSMKSPDSTDHYVYLSFDDALLDEKRGEVIKENAMKPKPTEPRTKEVTLTMTKSGPPPADNADVVVTLADPPSELSHTGDSGIDQGSSNVSLADILDCSDDDEDEEEEDEITDEKQAGTLDSVDSMDPPSAGGSCEGFSPVSSHPSSSPKAVDSGYDTENNESPEFVHKEPHEPREQTVGKPSLDTNPEEDQELEENEAVEATSSNAEGLTSQTDDHVLLPLSDKTPYRDSAYFSDYENERLSRDEGEELSERESDEHIAEMEEELREEQMKNEDDKETVPNTDRRHEMKCVSPGEPNSLKNWAAEVVGAMEEALGALNGGLIPQVKSEEGEDTDERTNPAEGSRTTEELLIKNSVSEISYEKPHHLPKDEVALQHTASSRRSMLPAAEGRGSPADGEEADEEDGDTDDSDESDEELRAYSMQEPSGGEESDEESHPVPIVVSDDSEAHKLRSLLKMPALIPTENQEEDLQSKKKTVTFFDDVTVYLFDQESPTKELTEHGFPAAAEDRSSRSKFQANASDDSSDGNISEESAGYEWEDDFPLLPLATSSELSDSPPPHSVPKAPDPKPAAHFSRFTVSPSSTSRFSITHISDSDMDSVGGSSEDIDKE
uniref:non-specific serine/threonine protein kinase n=1 Tax=Tetraodon nigroviridis TaxID=99883 RepID=H3D2V1_TETNG